MKEDHLVLNLLSLIFKSKDTDIYNVCKAVCKSGCNVLTCLLELVKLA